MKTTPAFHAEITAQVRQAQEDLMAARAAGDEAAASSALGRISDLREIQLNASENLVPRSDVA